MAGFGTGRHYHKYSYTVQDIAQATHRTPGTVRNDIARGKVIMDDIASIAMYLIWYTTRYSGDNAGGTDAYDFLIKCKGLKSLEAIGPIRTIM